MVLRIRDTTMAQFSEQKLPRDDLGLTPSDYPLCEYCQSRKIRGIHCISHPKIETVLRVGCHCVVGLTTDDKIAQQAERAMNNKDARRKKFPYLKGWKISAKGNHWIETGDHRVVITKPKNGKFCVSIDSTFQAVSFTEILDAKLHVFDTLNRRKTH